MQKQNENAKHWNKRNRTFIHTDFILYILKMTVHNHVERRVIKSKTKSTKHKIEIETRILQKQIHFTDKNVTYNKRRMDILLLAHSANITNTKCLRKIQSISHFAFRKWRSSFFRYKLKLNIFIHSKRLRSIERSIFNVQCSIKINYLNRLYLLKPI